jgi:hypothetical protein
MPVVLSLDMLAAEAKALAEQMDLWKTTKDGVLGRAAEHMLLFAERALTATEEGWSLLRADKLDGDVARVGQSVLSLLAKVEQLVAGNRSFFEESGISEDRWRAVRDQLREAIIEFASTWPTPHPYGPDFAANLWRADFAFEDGERGRPLAEVRAALDGQSGGR